MTQLPPPKSPYQVGGSLSVDAVSYVTRQADQQLYQALLRGDYCYVFNARQMGKSSLRVQTMQRLTQAGVRCGAIDLTTIGTQQITPEQWYASLTALLASQFQIPIKLGEWWRAQSEISWIGRLRLWIETWLFSQIEGPIVIFIDEADSVLGLPFATQDFFAFIRSCYEQRAQDANYQRLSFVLLGVATPADLMPDKGRTPFNIGTAIELTGFQFVEAMPLMQGLVPVISNPRSLLSQILAWTGGQPFLTQKLCNLVRQAVSFNADNINDIVQQQIIQNWESQDEPEHLRTIRDRLLHNPQQTVKLLMLYQRLVLSPEGKLPLDNSPEQQELMLSGLLHQRQGVLQIKNPIYEAIFNLDWIDQQLAPFMEALRPEAIRPEAVKPEAVRPEAAILEMPKLLAAEPLSLASAPLGFPWFLRPKWLCLGWGSTIALFLVYLVWQAGQFEQLRQQQIATDRIAAISLAQEKNWQPALFHGLRAAQMGMNDPTAIELQSQLQQIVYQAEASNRLRVKLFVPLKRLTQAGFRLNGQQIFVSDRNTQQVSLWNRTGQRLQQWQLPHQWLAWHPQSADLVSIDQTKPQTQQLINWRLPTSQAMQPARLNSNPLNSRPLNSRPLNAKLLTSLAQADASHLGWSVDGNTLMLARSNGQIQLRTANGQWVTSIQAHQGQIINLVPHPSDASLFASAGKDGWLRLWQTDGQPVNAVQADGSIVDLAFSQDGAILVSLLSDGQVLVLDRSGQLIKRWRLGMIMPNRSNSSNSPTRIALNHNATTVAIGFIQGEIHLYNLAGQLLGTLPGDQSRILQLDFSPENDQLLSASENAQVYLWNVAIATNPRLWLASGCAQLRSYLKSQPQLSKTDRERCDHFPEPN